MKQFYRIEKNIGPYMLFTLDTDDLMAKLGTSFDLRTFGDSKKDEWKTINGKFYSPDNGAITLPDMSIWHTNLLILNQKAYDALNTSLSKLGELLEISVEAKPYYLFNIMNKLDDTIVDDAYTEKEMFKGQCVGIKKLGFSESNIKETNNIFQIELDNGVNLYCSNKFKELVESSGLTGVGFNTSLA